MHSTSKPDRGPPLQPTPDAAALALVAWKEGETALAARDTGAAHRWFDRAHRLAPSEDRITLSLALAALGDGSAEETIGLLADVTARHDIRAAWLALAAAHRRVGDPRAAAAALAHALSSHVWSKAEAGRTATLDVLAAEAGSPGWCALTSRGVLLLGQRQAPDLLLALDGEPARTRGHRETIALAPGWERAGVLTVSSEGCALLGSPIRITRLRRLEGYVEARGGGLWGWAWYPADPAANPVLSIMPASSGRGAAFTIAARTAPGGRPLPVPIDRARWGPLARPRVFAIPAFRFTGREGLRGSISVRDRDGRDLTGSPLGPGRAPREWTAIARTASRRLKVCPEVPSSARQRDMGRTASAAEVDVIVPVHGAEAYTLACLRSVVRHLPRFARLIVIDDGSPEPDLRRTLDRFAAEQHATLLRNTRPRGFPAACNRGMRAARPGADILLLNSDTLVAEGWIEGLRAAIRTAPDIATATPFSNDATILSYPDPAGGNPIPDAGDTERLARLAARLFHGRAVEIPTGVGFCLYIRRRCLAEVGGLREEGFAQGYGEENDFCLRARDLGWRHVAAPGVFVTHEGAASFGVAGRSLRARNLAILNCLHPGYASALVRYRAADPLFPFRRRLDAARFVMGVAARRDRRQSVILITHDRGGGVFRAVRERANALHQSGLRPIVLFPSTLRGGEKGARVSDGTRREFPNLRFAIPRELGALARLLAPERPGYAECHHLLGHDHHLLDLCPRLGIPLDFILHDYAAFCARIALVGAARRYCGEPSPEVCAVCVADMGSEIEEDIAPADLVRRSSTELARARRLIVPTADAAERFHRHFPALTPIVTPREADARLPPLRRRTFGAERTVCVIGAIGVAKGYDVLLAAARDSAWRDLPLRFALVGYSMDDTRLLATGRVFVTGEYHEGEASELIGKAHADFAFLPSIWPETWCFALSEAWRAGLAVAAFDLGAQAERIRTARRGWLLPLGLSPSALNDALLGLVSLACP